MARRRTLTDHFARAHTRRVERVGKGVLAFLKKPDEENTHALRGAIRRLEASIQVLPKEVRKGEAMKEYRSRCEKVFRLTSKIRNLDIVEGKLARKSGNEGVAGMRKGIEQERKRLARRSVRAAWRLFELRMPVVDEKSFEGSSTRVRKLLRDLDQVIGSELVKVTTDETELEMLHSLRKNCKEFRCALELMPASSYKTEASELLQEWQDALGAVRDSDAMLRYLEESKRESAAKPLLATERAARHRHYQAFVRQYSEASAGTVMSLATFAGLD